MKNHLNFSKIRNLSIFLFSIIFMFSCGSASEDKAREAKLEEVKQSVQEDLVALKNDVSERIRYIDQEMEEADEETSQRLEEIKENLEAQVDRLDAQIDSVQDATLEEWEDVVSDVSAIATSVREETNDLTRRINELMEEEQ